MDASTAFTPDTLPPTTRELLPDAVPNGHVAAPSLLDALLEAPTASLRPALLDRFLAEPSSGQALALWLGAGVHTSREQIARRLQRDIARLDAVLTQQVNAILHHPAFQKLEASWRGLHYLVRQVPEGENIKVRVLSVSWKDLSRDLERAIEFDQSQLFRKIYEDEFGHAGGSPFGLLLGDYEIQHIPSNDHPDDLGALSRIAAVAAAAFAPFVAAASPALFDLNSFTELERPFDVARTFDDLPHLKWRALRDLEDARFVGLALPRVLMRVPYRDTGLRVDGFRFREEVEAPDRSGYLWGNAVYAFGSVAVRAFMQTGWFAGIRGTQRGVDGGGLVTGLPVHSFGTDRVGIAPKCSTEVIITDAQEKELGELGFIPLCHCQDTEYAAFFGNQSIQKPKEYDETPATINARLSAMLQYMLCVARFAHYVKVISRDWIGSYTNPADCEDRLRRWLMDYTNAADKGGSDLKAQYPLREAKVQVREHPGKPGSYLCTLHLRPHYQLDQMSAAVRLVTELSPGKTE